MYSQSQFFDGFTLNVRSTARGQHKLGVNSTEGLSGSWTIVPLSACLQNGRPLTLKNALPFNSVVAVATEDGCRWQRGFHASIQHQLLRKLLPGKCAAGGIDDDWVNSEVTWACFTSWPIERHQPLRVLSVSRAKRRELLKSILFHPPKMMPHPGVRESC